MVCGAWCVVCGVCGVQYVTVSGFSPVASHSLRSERAFSHLTGTDLEHELMVEVVVIVVAVGC